MEPRKHAARLQPDSPAFGYGVLASVIAIFLCACAISFKGQAAMASDYMGLHGVFAYLVPVVIDTSLLVYAAAALVRRARGESVRWVIAASGFWVVVSVGANMAHALQPSSIFVGAVLATLAPLAILMSSLTIESLLVAPPAVGQKLDREAALAATLEAERADHEATFASADQANDQLRKQIAALEAAAKVASGQTSAGTEIKGKSVASKPLASVPDLPSAEDRDARIIERRAEGATIPAISRELATSVSTVKRILATAKAAAA